MGKNPLSDSQLKAITAIIGTNSLEEAAKDAGVSRASIYEWLKQRPFKRRLEQERKALFVESLSLLKGATQKAVKTLIELLDSPDDKTKRLAAKEILAFSFKAHELELEERINRLEKFIEQNKEGFNKF